MCTIEQGKVNRETHSFFSVLCGVKHVALASTQCRLHPIHARIRSGGTTHVPEVRDALWRIAKVSDPNIQFWRGPEVGMVVKS